MTNTTAWVLMGAYALAAIALYRAPDIIVKVHEYTHENHYLKRTQVATVHDLTENFEVYMVAGIKGGEFYKIGLRVKEAPNISALFSADRLSDDTADEIFKAFRDGTPIRLRVEYISRPDLTISGGNIIGLAE